MYATHLSIRTNLTLFPDFAHSSTRRIVTFDIKIPASDFPIQSITIDGINKLSHPLLLQARKAPLSALRPAIQASVRKTVDNRVLSSSEDDDEEIIFIEDDNTLGTRVEQWAVEYTSRFVHAAGPAFYQTTIAHILGEAYVKKNLPEACSPPPIISLIVTNATRSLRL